MRRAVILLALIWASHSVAQVPLSEGIVEQRNIDVSFLRQTSDAAIRWSHTEERVGARYIRVHFKDVVASDKFPVRIVVRDRNSRIVQEFATNFIRNHNEFWSNVIEGDYLQVEVISPENPRGLSFKLADIAYQQNMAVPFSITIPDEREPAIKYMALPKLATRIPSVAKLAFIAGRHAASCTGFLIDDERMLTNEHCINNADVCDTTIAIFDYQADANGSVRIGNQFRCEKYIDSNRELDVALIKLSGRPGALYGHLPLTDRNIVENEQAYMIQHPAGEPKQISRKGCAVTTTIAQGNGIDTDFGHMCDTLRGSSGAPILGADFSVVGLHHFGFDETDRRWRTENRAVRMQRIIPWIQAR